MAAPVGCVNLAAAAVLALAGIVATAAPAASQEAGPLETFRGTTTSDVSHPDIELRINVLRWTAAEDREAILSLIVPEPEAEPTAEAAEPAAETAAEPAAEPEAEPTAEPAAEPGAEPATEDPADDETDLETALQELQTVGFIWTDGSLGYSLKYARRSEEAGGGERIVLLTGRPLGRWDRDGPWRGSDGSGPASEVFTVVEIRLGADGKGEGKMSVSGPIEVDPASGSVTLADYASAPVHLRDVYREPPPYWAR